MDSKNNQKFTDIHSLFEQVLTNMNVTTKIHTHKRVSADFDLRRLNGAVVLASHLIKDYCLPDIEGEMVQNKEWYRDMTIPDADVLYTEIKENNFKTYPMLLMDSKNDNNFLIDRFNYRMMDFKCKKTGRKTQKEIGCELMTALFNSQKQQWEVGMLLGYVGKDWEEVERQLREKQKCMPTTDFVDLFLLACPKTMRIFDLDEDILAHASAQLRSDAFFQRFIFNSWTCYVREHEKSIGFRFPVHPYSAKQMFAMRDLPEGKTRRVSLINFVKEHYRECKGETEGGEKKKVLVKAHLRGETKFTWNGLQIEICPSYPDLKAFTKELKQ